MKKILKLASSVFVLMALLSIVSCNSVDEEKVKVYLSQNPELFGLHSLPPERVILDSTRVIQAYDPLLDDNLETFSLWMRVKFMSFADKKQSPEAYEKCFSMGENNCDAVLVAFHYKKDPDFPMYNILFMKDGEFYQCLNKEMLKKIKEKAEKAYFKNIEKQLKETVRDNALQRTKKDISEMF